MSYVEYLMEKYPVKNTWSKGVENDITHSLDNGLDKTLANILKRTEKSVIDSTLNRKLTLHESLRNKIISEGGNAANRVKKKALIMGHACDWHDKVCNTNPSNSVKLRTYRKIHTYLRPEENTTLAGRILAEHFMSEFDISNQMNKVINNAGTPHVKPNLNQAARATKRQPISQQTPQSNGAPPESTSSMLNRIKAYNTARTADNAYRTPLAEQPSQPKTGFGAYLRNKAASTMQKSAGAVGNIIGKTAATSGKAFMAANAKVDQASRSAEKVMGNVAGKAAGAFGKTLKADWQKTSQKYGQKIDKWQNDRADMKQAKNDYKETQRQKKLDLVRDYGTSSVRGLAKQKFQQNKQMAKANDIATYGGGIGGWLKARSANNYNNQMNQANRTTQLNMAKNMQIASKPANFKKSFGGYGQMNPMLKDFQRWQSMYSA